MKRWWRTFKATLKLFGQVRATMLGAAIAFYAIFSLAPIAIIAVAVAGLILEDEVVRAEVEAYVEAELGPEPARLLGEMMTRAAEPGTGGIIASFTGILVLLYASTRLFIQLQKALNQIWEATPQAAGLRGQLLSIVEKRLVSFALVLLVGLFLVASVVFSAIVSALGEELARWIRLPPTVTRTAEIVVLGVLLAGAFTLIFKLLPDARVGWRAAVAGGVLSAILFSIGRIALGVFFGWGVVATEYGAASALVVVTLWVYYSAQVVFFGAVFTRAYTEDEASHQTVHVRPAWTFRPPPGSPPPRK